ncbi:YbdK family carboxylate-amine ligase [Agromyces sp. H3Y2-19a]|uniref:carboxylate-amine ligase n=1 Tax=Agromyces chromiiresistens TaxID=3030835 RepID=UPI0023BA3951|nr:YbdK family carboxylate-amine ligase [Agromyces chromiiresistens]MDF0512437.1 YbdK family carboxylate-amine ligase [Agromyces chromiiresistens]
MATFGIEEEFVFLDPHTLRPVDVADEAFAHLAAEPAWRAVAKREFLAAQVEHASAVFDTTGQATAALMGFRRELEAEARRFGVVVASVGTPPDALPFPTITDTPRYRRIVDDMQGVIADHQIQGLHVHVGVTDRDLAVRALNATRHWLPLLASLTGNSPIWRGHDTGYESWRNVGIRRWTTTGTPPEFIDAVDYDRRLERLIGVGGTEDRAVVMWTARLSSHVPTVEVRVADAQLEVGESVLVAALCRALVESITDPVGGPGAASAVLPDESAAAGPELLSAALLHAAHRGLSSTVFDPVLAELRPATEVVGHALELLAPALERSGDAEFVRLGLGRLLDHGTGAARQRAAFAASGMAGLRELYQATFTAEG